MQPSKQTSGQSPSTREPHVEFENDTYTVNTSELFVGPETDDIDGLELSAAASKLGVSIDEIWRRIRNGKMIARSVLGKVLVYTDLAPAPVAIEGLPPLPPEDGYLSAMPEARHGFSDKTLVDEHSLALTGSSIKPGHEIALLIDHLSLAKEENREILRLTQDSMARLTQMTDAMMEMKDSMIASKEEQMAILRQRLAEQTAALNQALREKEDLETLAQALQQG